jgi:hypothetical protein
MSFALIDAQRVDVSVATACSVLGVSVSGFYAWKNRGASPWQGVVTFIQIERRLPTTVNTEARDFNELACWSIA